MTTCLLGDIARDVSTGKHGSPMLEALKCTDPSRRPQKIKNWSERRLMCEACALDEGRRVACASALPSVRKVVLLVEGGVSSSMIQNTLSRFVDKTPHVVRNGFWRRHPDLQEAGGVVFGVLYTQAHQPGGKQAFCPTHLVFQDNAPSDPQSRFLLALAAAGLKLDEEQSVSAPNDGSLVANLFVERHGGRIAFEYADKYSGPPQRKPAKRAAAGEPRRSPRRQWPREHVRSSLSPQLIGQPALDFVGSATDSPASSQQVSSESESPEALYLDQGASNLIVNVADWLGSE